jgi:protein-L-isoaspartate(D-aspartate) O-methyltransferase
MVSTTRTATLRRRYAQEITRNLGQSAQRIRDAFATVPREHFLPPPPWTVISMGAASTTSDLADVYTNNLVAIDRARGINNGEPALHAAWIDAVDPRRGDTVVHVGAGLGYYSAILATLVGQEGRVIAYEVEEDLAAAAARNLESLSNVTVRAESALGQDFPDSDIIYVNAGLLAPDSEWLRALKPHGRLIFPWQPVEQWGPAVLVTRRGEAFSAQPIMTVGFIPCSGQGKAQVAQITEAGIADTRSLWISAHRPPDESATLIGDGVWFSSDAVA